MAIATRTVFICLLLMVVGHIASAQVENSERPHVRPHEEQASSASAEEQLKTVARESAVSLVIEVGQEADGLPGLKQKIRTKFEAAVILARPRPDIAIKFLESAWADSFSGDEVAGVTDLRASILTLTEQIAPDKAKAWVEQVKGKQRTDESGDPSAPTSDLSPEQIKRRKADSLVLAALAKLNSQPQQGVSEALASLQRAGKISTHLTDAVKALNEKNQTELSGRLKRGLADYVLARTSIDPEDLDVIVFFLISGGELEPLARGGMLSFLLASTRQILANQGSTGQAPKLPESKISELYTVYKMFLRPAVERSSAESLPAFDDVLRELAAFVPASRLETPMLNPEELGKQIEDAKRIVGSEPRDVRLIKIAGWLLSRRLRDKESSLKLAAEVAAEVTNGRLRESVRDAIKLVGVESLAGAKDFIAAEQKADSIADPEWRAWTLAVLGKIQESNPSIATQLYEKSLASLRRAWPSPYRAELTFLVAALQTKQNSSPAFETLARAVEYANQAREEVDKKPSISNLMLSIEIGGFGFASTDTETRAEDISLSDDLGKLALLNWNTVFQLGRTIQNPVLRSRFHLLTAKTVVKDTAPNGRGRAF